MDWTGGLDWWTGLDGGLDWTLDWTGGLDWWTGLDGGLDGGLDWWTDTKNHFMFLMKTYSPVGLHDASY